jgi:hypothetical protein
MNASQLWGMNKFEVTFNRILRYNFPHTTQSLCGSPYNWQP